MRPARVCQVHRRSHRRRSDGSERDGVCSICGKCVYFFYFCTGSMCMGNFRMYLFDAVFCFICSQVAITSRTRPRLGGGWRRRRRNGRTARGSSAPEPRGTRRGRGRRGRRRRWTSRIESHLSHSGSTLIQMQTEGIMRMRDTRRGSSIARTGAARCVGTPTSSRTRPRRRDATRRFVEAAEAYRRLLAKAEDA